MRSESGTDIQWMEENWDKTGNLSYVTLEKIEKNVRKR
jgi:hypothetical protein